MLWSPQEMFFDSGHPQGYLPLVDHLEKQMALLGVPMAPGENDIIITSGFQRALSVLLRLLVKPGGKVAIETPGYSAIINLLVAEGIPWVAIPVDSEGMETSALAATLARGDVQAVITMPTFHNPTGATLSPARRGQLLQLAAQYDIPVIEDDWARELRYEGTAAPPLKALDGGGYVVHIGTFSKSFMPGLRLGWITCPSALAKLLVYAKLGADQGDSYFLQAFLHEFISRGHYARHLRHVLAEYRKRRNALCRQLTRHLPAGCRFLAPTGGFTVWLELPPAIESLRLLPLARQLGIEFLPAAYCLPDRRDTHALRLAFSRTTVPQIDQAIPALCQLISRCLENPALLTGGEETTQ
jgi:2-aminoadipate transaminase